MYFFILIYQGYRESRKKHDSQCRIELKLRLTPTDLFAGLYGFALLLSYACSEYQESAFLGSKGWYMGLLPQLFLVLIYFFVSKLWMPRKYIFYLFLPVSAVVFGLGYLNRFGFYPIDMKLVNPEFISTIGNINWYCGYMVTVLFAGVALLWMEPFAKKWQKILLMVYVSVGFMAMVTQGSSSGVVTLLVILFVLFWMSARDGKRMLAFWQEMILLSGSCMITLVLRKISPERFGYEDRLINLFTDGMLPIIMTVVSFAVFLLVSKSLKQNRYREKLFFILARVILIIVIATSILLFLLALINTFRPGSLGKLSDVSFFTLDAEWGSRRGATWGAGWRCFWEQNFLHKLVGVGPDAMSAFLSSGASPELSGFVKDFFDNTKLTNAHNEWLTILVDTGILGLVAFAGMIISGIRDFLRSGKDCPAAYICGFALLAYTVNNIFSFQQSMSVSTLFVMFGMGRAMLNQESKG